VDLLLFTASASKRSANNLCVHHELHEYDQDDDFSNAFVPHALLSHDVFTFRKVLVAIQRLGGLFERTEYLAFS